MGREIRMQVKLEKVKPGHILSENIIGRSGQPIMLKGTQLQEEYLEILQHFLVETVDVHHQSNDEEGNNKSGHEDIVQGNGMNHSLQQFKEAYIGAVAAFKKQFEQWKSSIPVYIPDVRDLIIPILERLETVDDSIIFHLPDLIDDPKNYLYHHCVSTALISARLAKALGYMKGEWIQVGLAGLLSDCGMSKINEELLEIQGPLTPNQLKQIQKHPTLGYHMIRDLPALTSGVQLAVLQHHERANGGGYPLGMTLNKIHRFANIVAVADVFHAIVSVKSYREAKGAFAGVEELLKGRIRLYDSEAVDTLIHFFIEWIKGATVRLNNGEMAEILFISQSHPTRPIIKVIQTGEVYALAQNTDLSIQSVLV